MFARNTTSLKDVDQRRPALEKRKADYLEPLAAPQDLGGPPDDQRSN